MKRLTPKLVNSKFSYCC